MGKPQRAPSPLKVADVADEADCGPRPLLGCAEPAVCRHAVLSMIANFAGITEALAGEQEQLAEKPPMC